MGLKVILEFCRLFHFVLPIAGNTALHVACGSLTADPHRLGNSSYIPSTLFIGPNTNIVRMLLSYGAKVRQRNNQVICLTSIVRIHLRTAAIACNVKLGLHALLFTTQGETPIQKTLRIGQLDHPLCYHEWQLQ